MSHHQIENGPVNQIVQNAGGAAKLTVDGMFASLIPPLSGEEYAQLEENLLVEGCRDPLVVWGNILIDGHNRLTICEKHGIPYQVVAKEFTGRDDALRYIILNQFGRRNLSVGDRSMLAMKLEPLVKAEAKSHQQCSLGRGKKDLQNSGNHFDEMITDRELAKIAGVSHDTIHKVRKIAKHGTPEQIVRIQKGGRGDSVNAVYQEVRNSQKSERTDAETKESLKRIRDVVADLKNPDLDRSFTTKTVLNEYAGFANMFLRGLDTFANEPYVALYPLMDDEEREYWKEINEEIIAMIQKTILLGKG